MTAKAALSCQSLSYCYPDGTRALHDVTFSVEEGASVALVGANGAGKSTLALLAVGTMFPTAGSLKLLGTEVSAKNLVRIRRQLGLLCQNPDDQLFMPTVLDDVAFGPLNLGLGQSEARQAACSALAMVGLEHLKDRFPGHLSEGEKRLAALASVLSMKPHLLILDEPSAGLDPRSRRRLIEQLARLEQTKIIISHDLEMVLDLCPRAILLDQGNVWADRNSLELLADPVLMKSHGLEVPYSLSPDHEHRFKLAGSPHEINHK